MMRLARAFVLVPLASVGCSLLGLGDYDVPTCDPTATFDECRNECNDGHCVGCLVYQCDPVRRRCTLGTLDHDRDSDPPVSCGGTDCDDNDPKRSGKLSETCDGIDNNCNGLVDEGVVGTHAQSALTNLYARISAPAITHDPVGGTIASFISIDSQGATCIAVASDSVTTLTNGCATFPVEPVAPAQPYTRLVGETFPQNVVTAYVRLDQQDALSIRSTLGAAIDPMSGDGYGTLPSIIAFGSSGAAPSAALVTSYVAPIAASCTDVRPSPLVARLLTNATTSKPTLQAPIMLTASSASMRPAALVRATSPGTAGNAILVIAPDESSGIGLWNAHGMFFANKLDVGALFAGARSVDAALATVARDQPEPIAIVAEIGCPPNQAVKMAKGTLIRDSVGDVTGVHIDAVVAVGSGGSAPASPAVGFEPAPYDEWRVTWIADGNTFLQRFTLEGVAVGDPIPLRCNTESTFSAAAYGSRSNVVLVASTNVCSVSIGCR